MRKTYDFSKSGKNPYASRLKKRVTIRLEEGAVAYFKILAEESGIPHQTPINLHLRDCAATNRRLNIAWKPENRGWCVRIDQTVGADGSASSRSAYTWPAPSPPAAQCWRSRDVVPAPFPEAE